MRVLVGLVVLFGTLLTVASAEAQDAVPTPPSIPPGDDVIITTHVGDRATVAGMLLDTDTAIRWTNRLTWWRDTFRLHLEHDVEATATIEQSHQLQLQLVQDSYTREIEGLRTDLREAVTRYETELAARRNPPFYETWGFAFGLGGVCVAIVGVLIGVLVASL